MSKAGDVGRPVLIRCSHRTWKLSNRRTQRDSIALGVYLSQDIIHRVVHLQFENIARMVAFLSYSDKYQSMLNIRKITMIVLRDWI